jgi:hypothetical protein
MKLIKYIIALFFLVNTFWTVYLIFSRLYSHPGMEFSVDSGLENHFMMLIIGTTLSMVSVFLNGLLSLFTHWVFVKLLFIDDIKKSALEFLKRKRSKLNRNKTV